MLLRLRNQESHLIFPILNFENPLKMNLNEKMWFFLITKIILSVKKLVKLVKKHVKKIEESIICLCKLKLVEFYDDNEP